MSGVVTTLPWEKPTVEAIHAAAFLRTLSLLASRRRVLGGLAAGLLAARSLVLGADDAAAGKKRKRRKRRKNRKGKNRPKRRVAATCPGPGDTNLGDASGDSRIAQTFTALVSGPLIEAEVQLDKLEGSPGDFVLRLSPVEDSGEVVSPTNDVLAEASLANDAVAGGESAVTFSFADPFRVVAGVVYALVLTRPGGGPFAWSGHGNTCPGQSFTSLNGAEEFFDTGPDLIFTAVVRS